MPLWTAEEDDLVRRDFPTRGARAVARDLGRTPLSVKQRAMKLGARSLCWWTPEEDDDLRRSYAEESAVVIGARLGRHASAVYKRAEHLGLCEVVTHISGDQPLLEQIADLARQGLGILQIASETGRNRQGIRRALKRMGIRADGAKRRAEANREARRKQLETLGLEPGRTGSIRTLAFRKHARERGWPEDLGPREVQIIELLCDHGPQTLRQLVVRMGLRRDRKYPLCGGTPGRSYPSELERRGLAYRVMRVIKDPNTGNLVDLYFPTMAALEIRQAFLARQGSTT